jgi:OTU domain-containing protein 3
MSLLDFHVCLHNTNTDARPGNCLFNALSDQLFGSQADHDMIRARTIEYMRENAEYYKMFMECNPGGGVRRNPKRKTAGGYSSFNASVPTPDEIDRVFESHLDRMAKGGTWGDNMEIVAFSSAFEVDVKIYQSDLSYMIRAAGEDDVRPVCHIAYHVSNIAMLLWLIELTTIQAWEHYSSIRNLNGPHHGTPNVSPKDVAYQELHQAQAKISQPPIIDAQKVKIVRDSLPHYVDDETVARTLKECSGNINNAVDKLLDIDDQRSTSSQQSSLDRESDSSDDNVHTPSKKQDRRLSRASKSAIKSRQEKKKRQIALKLETYGDSLDSLVTCHTPPPVSPRKRNSTVLLSDDEDSSPSPLKDGDTSSGSEYAVPDDIPKQTVTGLKLRLPKPQTSNQPKLEPTPEPAASPAPKRIAARDSKILKKQAQKTAAKERKQATFHAANSSKRAAKSGEEAGMPNSHPTMATAIRTLYI